MTRKLFLCVCAAVCVIHISAAQTQQHTADTRALAFQLPKVFDGDIACSFGIKYLTATLPVLSVSRQELLRNAYSVQTAVH